MSFGKESRYIDHRVHGVQGLVTLIGIRYTTARGDSARALDLLLEQMPRAPARAPTESVPLAGGDIDDFSALQASARREVNSCVPTAALNAWLHNYGTEYRALAALAEESSNQRESLGQTATLAAEVTFAVRDEMAMRLQDVVLRRTELGSGAHPGAPAIQQAAHCMQGLLGWTERKRMAEIADTENVLRDHHATVPGVANCTSKETAR